MRQQRTKEADEMFFISLEKQTVNPPNFTTSPLNSWGPHPIKDGHTARALDVSASSSFEGQWTLGVLVLDDHRCSGLADHLPEVSPRHPWERLFKRQHKFDWRVLQDRQVQAHKEHFDPCLPLQHRRLHRDNKSGKLWFSYLCPFQNCQDVLSGISKSMFVFTRANIALSCFVLAHPLHSWITHWKHSDSEHLQFSVHSRRVFPSHFRSGFWKKDHPNV